MVAPAYESVSEASIGDYDTAAPATSAFGLVETFEITILSAKFSCMVCKFICHGEGGGGIFW